MVRSVMESLELIGQTWGTAGAAGGVHPVPVVGRSMFDFRAPFKIGADEEFSLGGRDRMLTDGAPGLPGQERGGSGGS
jgi:hypothetical protein